MIYQIDYDLRQPGRDYTSLYAAIQSLGDARRVLKSTWVVDARYTAVQIRDHLAKYMDRNDGVLVTRLTGEAAWHGLEPAADQWLHDKLSRAA